MVGSDGILRFHFRARDLRVAEIACSEESIARQVEELTAQLQDPGSELWQSPAANLADVLLGDLWLHDRPPRRLYIVPDGGLHTLAFEVLRPLVSESDPPRALILDLGEVVYAQSATMLLEGGEPGAGSRTIAGTDLVAFGDPEFNAGGASGAGSRPELASIARLPHAQVEVERIGGLYPQAKVFVGEEATEERFFAEAPRARIIHIAAHAFVDDRHPKFSGIVMSPTAGQGPALEQDGLVQAFEVLEHDLPSDLAVLSACETGLGPLLRGEGLLGLSRAFRLAGVRNLVVSLWKVDDLATAAFMYEFHSRLRGTGTPSAALREAKLAFAAADVAGIPDGSPPGSELRGVARRHRGELRGGPAVWASFVLVGGAVR
jgi:CHAT domain-containing protein